MSSVVIKSEEIIVDTNEYNSDDVDEELNLTLEDTGGEIYQHRIGYSKSHQNQDSSHAMTTIVSSQQHHRNEMNMSNANDQMGVGGKNSSSKNILESEKRIRREIANSNERRRMQSINAGFQNLRALLPRHEGEKLSKAAILQQTSQYICDLENQKTQLLAQNSQLKRTLGQHELALSGYGTGSGNVDDGCTAIKKRKLTDNVLSLQPISDSSDEGLGSVSPEPTTLLQSGNPAGGVPTIGLTKTLHGNAYITHSAKELLELKKQLEKERRLRSTIEEELRVMKRRVYTENYVIREVIDHTDNVREDEGHVSYIGLNEKNEHTEVVVCSSIEEMNDDCAEIISEENIQEEIILTQDTESVKYSDSSTFQPILQAAIKAKPKVEVERINETVMKISPDKDTHMNQNKKNNSTNGSTAGSGSSGGGGGGASIGITRSRQNLETIVEAIRHLEGDHLFGESAGQQKKAQKSQESPLALTTKQLVSTAAQPLQHQHQQQQQRKTIAELSPFLHIKNPKISSANIVTIVRGRSIALNQSGENPLSISNVTNPSTHSSSVVTSAISTSTTMPSSNNNSSSSNNNNNNNNNNTNNNTNNSSSNNSSNANNSTSSSMIPTNSGAVVPTAIVKVQTPLTSSSGPIAGSPSHITITTASHKQCRPGVIVAKQIS